MPSNTHYASLGSDHELDRLSTAPKRHSAITREVERKRRIAWLPWLILAAVATFSFLLSMIYGIANLDTYRRSRPQWYLTSWLIFGVPTLLFTFLVVTPFPSSLRQARRELSKRTMPSSYIPTVNVFNAILCLFTVIAYLYIGAFPGWNSPQWNNKVEYRQRLPIPAFAFVYWSDALGETYYPVKASDFSNTTDLQECRIANISDPSGQTYDCSHAFSWTTIDKYPMHIFDPSLLPIEHSTINDLQTTVWLQSWVKYDSRKAGTNAYPSTTSMGGVFFDPSMNMSKGFECGFLKIASMPVFATTYASVELLETQDDYDLLDLSANTSRNGRDCSDLREAVFGTGKDNKYLSWNSAFTSMPKSNLSYCDIKNYGNKAGCPIQVGLSYTSQIVNKALTEPGVDKLTIWLNAGAVVGGVQFFFWFLTILAST